MRTVETKTDRGTEHRKSDFENVFCILAGDTTVVRRFFFRLVRKGFFRKLMAHYGSDIEFFLEDLCAEVFLAFFIKDRDGSLGSIRNPNGFLFKVIEYKSRKENKYVARLFLFEGIKEFQQ